MKIGYLQNKWSKSPQYATFSTFLDDCSIINAICVGEFHEHINSNVTAENMGDLFSSMYSVAAYVEENLRKVFPQVWRNATKYHIPNKIV